MGHPAVERKAGTLPALPGPVSSPLAKGGKRGVWLRARIGSCVLALLSAVVLSGCAAPGTLDIIKLGNKRIRTSGPLMQNVRVDECYHWLDDDGRLCVAMRAFKPSLRGKEYEVEYLLSLVLEEPPAGSARFYQVNRRTLRARRDAGYTHTRSASLMGVVGIWDYADGSLEGRLRITTLQQSYLVLTGWRSVAQLLLVGEFTSRLDREKGEAILARTEEGAVAREAAPKKPIRGAKTPVQSP